MTDISEERAHCTWGPEKKNAHKSSSTQSILMVFLLYWSKDGHSLLKKIKFREIAAAMSNT
jgi:hypothetical protein